MIHTEKGRLDELIKMVAQDRLYVLETLGLGPTGPKSRDRRLIEEGRLAQRAKDLFAILEILRSLKSE